jgi:hypothetical protein
MGGRIGAAAGPEEIINDDVVVVGKAKRSGRGLMGLFEVGVDDLPPPGGMILIELETALRSSSLGLFSTQNKSNHS